MTRAENVQLLHQERSWREVKAQLVTSAPARTEGFSDAPTVWVPGRWQARPGSQRSGLVPTAPGTPAGARVPIWIDGHGDVTNVPPISAAAVAFRVIVVEILAAIGLAAAGIGIGCAVRWVTNRRRMAYWAIEWACFGPRWSARH